VAYEGDVTTDFMDVNVSRDEEPAHDSDDAVEIQRFLRIRKTVVGQSSRQQLWGSTLVLYTSQTTRICCTGSGPNAKQ